MTVLKLKWTIDFQLFVTYHSYGQYILYPWGFDKDKNAPNWRKMHAMAEVAGRAMQDHSGHKYTIGAAAKVLYPAAGEDRCHLIHSRSCVFQIEYYRAGQKSGPQVA